MLLFALNALYVGNSACAPCHANIVRTYSATAMARSSGAVAGGLNPGTFRHAPSKTEYRMQDSGLVTAARGTSRLQRQLDYFVGSGTAGQSFLYFRGEFLFQAPVTWYSQPARWDVSPGYEKDEVSRWNRAIEPECLNCHASQIRFSPAYQNRYADPPFAQGGIGCERCHGPGSEHVQGKGTLVNPAKLEPAKRDSVCAQCHMSGEERVDRVGKRWMDYRPGSLLSDYTAYFVTEKTNDLKAASYVEKLATSKCKTTSGDRLWCGTCHDPHRAPAAAERVAWYRAKCLTCHADYSCGRPGDCSACHMPKAKVVDVTHGVLTDHAIPKLPIVSAVAKASWRLIPFSAKDGGDRELGLAYAALAYRTGDSNQASEALRLLSAARPDPEVQLAMANLYASQGDYSRSLPLLQGNKINPGFAPALTNFGVYLALTGNIDQALTIWRGILRQNPCNTEAGVNLAKALKSKGKSEGVTQILASQSGCLF